MAPPARDRILDALQGLLLDKGATAVTLEAVAAAAGVSKGGLLYHFRSKAALVDGLGERLRRTTDARIAEAQAQGVVRTYLRLSLPGNVDSALFRATFIAMRGMEPEVAAIASRSMAESCERWRSLVRASVPDPLLAATVLFVADGLCLSDVTDVPHDRADEIALVVDDLVARADAAVDAAVAGTPPPAGALA